MSVANRTTNMRFYALAILAYVIASFIVQAVSHFAINTAHYDAIEFMRKDQIMELYQRSLIRTHAPICACRGT